MKVKNLSSPFVSGSFSDSTSGGMIDASSPKARIDAAPEEQADSSESPWKEVTACDKESLRIIVCGNHLSRVYSGNTFLPKIHNGQWSLAARTIMKERNLTAARSHQPLTRMTSTNDASNESAVTLESLMVGPCDFFGSMPQSWKFEFKIQIDADGVPQFLQRPITRASLHPGIVRLPIESDMIGSMAYDWISGKAARYSTYSTVCETSYCVWNLQYYVHNLQWCAKPTVLRAQPCHCVVRSQVKLPSTLNVCNK